MPVTHQRDAASMKPGIELYLRKGNPMSSPVINEPMAKISKMTESTLNVTINDETEKITVNMVSIFHMFPSDLDMAVGIPMDLGLTY